MQGWHVALQRFEGTLAHDDQSINVGFAAGVTDTGDVRITLDPIARTPESRFIRRHWEGEASQFGKFVLHGAADDGTIFHTDDMFFTTLGLVWQSDAGAMRPKAYCSVARLALARSHEDQDGVRLLVRGLNVSCRLAAETPLGALTVQQTIEDPLPFELSGEIRLQGVDVHLDEDDWLDKVDKLFDDIRHALSFGLGLMIAGPIREVVKGAEKTLLVNPNGPEGVPYMAPFQSHELEPIFTAAVRRHCESAPRVKNLQFAITWLVMHVSYAEGRLITAMTALENLISIHHDKKDDQILSNSQASGLRKAFRVAAEAYARDKIDESYRERFLSELEVKLPELNRRTLRQKIDILAHRWSVSLDGLETEAIDAAKKARDVVVHTGTYQPKNGDESGLFEHAVVARELVVRFILAALDYEGDYRSYIGGYHKRTFSRGKNGPSTW